MTSRSEASKAQLMWSLRFVLTCGRKAQSGIMALTLILGVVVVSSMALANTASAAEVSAVISQTDNEEPETTTPTTGVDEPDEGEDDPEESPEGSASEPGHVPPILWVGAAGLVVAAVFWGVIHPDKNHTDE